MEQLISLAYNNPPVFNKNTILTRKVSIDFENTIIYATKKSGATYAIFAFLSGFNAKKYLYIDFQDLIFKEKNFDSLINEINTFMSKEENISVVVIDNAPYPIINTNNKIIYILSMDISLSKTKTELTKDFKIHHLYPLDFQEYTLFNKHKTTNIFNLFIKDSTFTQIAKNATPILRIALQNIIYSSIQDEQEREVFYLYLKHQGLDVSIFQMYGKIKKNIKISKDKFYEKSKILQDKRFLFLLNKHNQPRANKKAYFLDFNMPKAINPTINLKESIKNAIFLEMIKNNTKKDEIFYTDELDFYIPTEKKAVILMIFKELDDIKEHIWYLDAMININKNYLKKVKIITIDEQSSGYKEKIKGTKYEVLTFWEFAMQ